MNPRVIGIDVGGTARGFRAVALRGPEILAKLRTRDPVALARWCVEQEPVDGL